MSLFSGLAMAPADPIMGLTDQFKKDQNPNKVNLGVGVYQNADGKLPLLRCVAEVEQAHALDLQPRGYLPIPGHQGYIEMTRKLVFGADSEAIATGRIVTTQSIGGTGGLRVGAQFLRNFFPAAKVLVPDPSWENHRALFGATGFEVGTYRYFDADNNGIDFAGLLEDLTYATPGTIVLLHACCHNPTGYDLDNQQWDQVIEAIKTRELVPFLDFAYQGFGEGTQEDAFAIRKFVDSGLEFICTSSYSKTMSLYGERVGSLSVVCQDAESANRVLSQVKTVIRTLYSNPPTHSAAVVAEILSNPRYYQMWDSELTEMRQRIWQNRIDLVERLNASGKADMSFITKQRGMFSYLGLDKHQMLRLRYEHGVYGTEKGRICVAALNPSNIDYVAEAILAVIE